MNIRERVRANMVTERKSRRYKQSEIAEALGVTTKSVSDWETGRTDTPYDSLEKLAAFYGLSGGGLWFYNNVPGTITGDAPAPKGVALTEEERKRWTLFNRFLDFEKKHGRTGDDSLKLLYGSSCADPVQHTAGAMDANSIRSLLNAIAG